MASYEIYKNAVGGKTWEGKDMMEFSEMEKVNPKVAEAWKEIDNHYNKKILRLMRDIQRSLVIFFDEEIRDQDINKKDDSNI